jgi:hypothetical protein
MKITASATITYDTNDVLSELKSDYPNDTFDTEYAKEMIMNWITDDFGNTLADVEIKEEN